MKLNCHELCIWGENVAAFYTRNDKKVNNFRKTFKSAVVMYFLCKGYCFDPDLFFKMIINAFALNNDSKFIKVRK